jgi:hypothetical protein
MVASGISAFLIYLVTSELSNLVVSCFFGLVSTMGFNALGCLGPELFPTGLRCDHTRVNFFISFQKLPLYQICPGGIRSHEP